MPESFKKYAKILLIAVLLLVALVLIIKNGSRTKTSTVGNINLSFYVNDEMGAEVIRPAAGFPPLIDDNGKPTLVRAFKYSYDDGKTSKIGYLFKYSDEAKAQLEALPPYNPNSSEPDPRPTIMQRGELVRSPEPGSKWVSAHDPQAQQIRALPTNGPNGASARWINPSK